MTTVRTAIFRELLPTSDGDFCVGPRIEYDSIHSSLPDRLISVELFADDLDALVTALDIDRPVVCGLSTGGCIAQVSAPTHPERISGLVQR